MLEKISSLSGYAVQASDGWMGKVSDFLFDDESWKIRWLVADTSNWLGRNGRQVLIPPPSIGSVDHSGKILSILMTRTQALGSPDILENLGNTPTFVQNDVRAWPCRYRRVQDGEHVSSADPICNPRPVARHKGLRRFVQYGQARDDRAAVAL